MGTSRGSFSEPRVVVPGQASDMVVHGPHVTVGSGARPPAPPLGVVVGHEGGARSV